MNNETGLNTNGDVQVNREYKDRLFRFIFGSTENKKYLLSLYNAVNGTVYEDENDMEITTLDDVIYIKMKNDVSFLFDSELSLYEHQSTYNPNMPLRGMMYFSSLYRQLLSERKADLYTSTLLSIPTPKYYVFYNGDEKQPDRQDLKLSSSFEKKDSTGDFEWTATMLNINKGHNKEIMERCEALKQYSYFVANVKENKKHMPLIDAVNKAVEDAISENYLNGFFKTHKEGVVNMSLTEYNEEEFIANRRAEGKLEEKCEVIMKLSVLVDNEKLTLSQAALVVGMTEEEFLKIKEQAIQPV